MATSTEVEQWAEAYRQAWENGDSESAAALFSEHGNHRANIVEEPFAGPEGVKEYWSGVTESQSNVTVHMGTPFVDGSRVAVEFWTTMLSSTTQRSRCPVVCYCVLTKTACARICASTGISCRGFSSHGRVGANRAGRP